MAPKTCGPSMARGRFASAEVGAWAAGGIHALLVNRSGIHAGKTPRLGRFGSAGRAFGASQPRPYPSLSFLAANDFSRLIVRGLRAALLTQRRAPALSHQPGVVSSLRSSHAFCGLGARPWAPPPASASLGGLRFKGQSQGCCSAPSALLVPGVALPCPRGHPWPLPAARILRAGRFPPPNRRAMPARATTNARVSLLALRRKARLRRASRLWFPKVKTTEQVSGDNLWKTPV